MNYEKKYKEALERMKSWAKGEHPECFSEAQKTAEFIFPELKESEDERIRKAIIEFFKLQDDNTTYSFIHKKDILAWLEKQREQTRAKLGQSEVTKTSDQELSDKIEPKFKVGDYIVFNGLILHIDEVVNGYYRTTSIGDGIHNSYDWDIDNAARLWTIQEAKDGDVLYLQHEGVEHIIIYKRLVKENFHTILSVHCAYDGSTKDFFEDVSHYHCITSERDEKEIHPATKEQQDLLFAKMKEAGYEWDGNKKELKKMEIKSKNFEPKKLDADKVIEWLKPYSVIEDNIINEFKKDFGL